MAKCLSRLPLVKWNGEEFGERIIDADKRYNLIDCSNSMGGKLIIETEFVNHLDLSEANIREVFLKGEFNFVNFSNATIEKLSGKFKISISDKANAKVKTVVNANPLS